MSDQFGSVVTGDEVEDAVTATLQAWLPHYLPYIARLKCIDTEAEPDAIPLPRSWNVLPDFETFPERHLPALVVLSPGTSGDVEQHSSGAVDAPYSIGVAVWLSANEQDQARRLSWWYSRAVSMVLVQQPVLVQGEPVVVRWTGESKESFPQDQIRTIGAVRNTFTLDVDHVMDSGTGPVEAEEDPNAMDAYPDYPTADTGVVHPDIQRLLEE